MRCANCNGTSFSNLKAARTLDLQFKFKGKLKTVVFRAQAPVRKCSRCGTEYEVGPIRSRMEQTVALNLIERGINAGGVLRFARKALGLRAVDLAQLLGITPETVSHWENDKTQAEPVSWVAIRDLLEDGLRGRSTTRDQLAAFATPNLPSTTVDFELQAEAS